MRPFRYLTRVLHLAAALVLVCSSCSTDDSDGNEGAAGGTDTTTDAVDTAGGTDGANTTDARTGDSESPDLTEDAGPEETAQESYFIDLFDNIRINSVGDENVRTVTTGFDWENGPFESVTLVVDLDSTCFPFNEWTRPPEGHNWPADCDAFDRNFELTMDPPEGDSGSPAIELVRAITPFGGPMHIEVDVTDIANGLPGSHQFQCHISTWSDGSGQVTGSAGGWNVTARFDVMPGTPPRRVLAVVPLTNHSYGSDSGTVETAFQVPAGVTDGRIEYRVTGHGGASDDGAQCIGPAEEFCRRWHYLDVDGDRWQALRPWRDDCTELCTLTTEGVSFEYCAENPTGAIGSVRAPRANWCPGSVTPPVIVDAAELSVPGEHTFAYEVDGVAPGGSWRTSALFIGTGE